MSRLFCDGRDVAQLEVADAPSKRLLGLLKRDSIHGALLLPRTNSVHTLGMRFAIDVAYCTRSSVVVDVITMKPNRIGRPRLSAQYVVEATAGSFREWGIQKGSVLEERS